MFFRTAILLFLLLLLHVRVGAVSLLTIDAEQDKGEEGITSSYSLTYIQTDGTFFDNPLEYGTYGWDVSNMNIDKNALSTKENTSGLSLFKYSLAFNSTVSFTTDLAVGNSFTASIRKNNNPSMAYDASFEFTRSDNNITVSLYYEGKSVKSVNVPLSKSVSSFDVHIDANGPTLRLWVNSDISKSPSLTADGCLETEGYFQVKNGDFYARKGKGATSFTNLSFKVDYAYGLQFILNKVPGSYIHDVYKNDNRLLYHEYKQSKGLSPNMTKLIESIGIDIPSYKYNTKPPIISNSKSDAGYWYCDNKPTSMEQPIPYGSVYFITWLERVDSCGPVLENRVSVKLLNHPDDEIYNVHKCPCSERTCFLDSVYISAPTNSFCGGDPLLVSANLVGPEELDRDEYEYSWSVNEIPVPDVNSADLPLKVPGNVKVKVNKIDNPVCKATSTYYTVKMNEKPLLCLKDTSGCVGAGVTVYAVSSQTYAPYYKYKWSTGETSQYIKVKSSGTYAVRVTNGTCVDSAVAVIDVDTCVLPSLDSLYIPKVVTPNGDGVNDAFAMPMLSERYPNARVAVYDRSGKLLCEKDAGEFSWDGTYNGNKMPSTDYWYEIYVYELYRYYRGHFTLLWDDGR